MKRSLREPFPRQCRCRQHHSLKNVVAVAGRWQLCVRFNRLEISTTDFPLQRRTCCPSTSIHCNIHKGEFTQYPFFVRFRTFLLLLEKVCAFESAFLYVHIRTNQTVTYWTKVFRKKCFVKGYCSILNYSSYRSYTKYLNKIFIYT